MMGAKLVVHFSSANKFQDKCMTELSCMGFECEWLGQEKSLAEFVQHNIAWMLPLGNVVMGT